MDPLDPLNVTVRDPIHAVSLANCAWNTNMTYDFALLDINGDGKLDLWSGHGRGNQVFLQETPSDCDGNGVPDRCVPNGGATPGGENTPGACCPMGRPCFDTFEPCCQQPGSQWMGWLGTCSDPGFNCPQQFGPQPGP